MNSADMNTKKKKEKKKKCCLLHYYAFSAIIATMAAPTILECLTIPTDNLAAICSGNIFFNVLQTRG
jgi:hypothetical protein